MLLVWVCFISKKTHYMSKAYMEQTVHVEGINMHYLEYPEIGETMVMLHSLSANAHIFAGLVARGLSQDHHLLIPDLRGRGDSSKPIEGYSLEQTGKDVISFLDVQGLEKVILCGHSFGALLGIYLTAHYPERVSKLIILDAAVELNPFTPILIQSSTMRMLMPFPSWDAYVAFVRIAPFMNRWDAAILPFLKHDTVTHANGSVTPKNIWTDVTKAAYHVFRVSSNDWRRWLSKIDQPTLLLYASEPFVAGHHIVMKEKVMETIALLKNGEDRQIEGNHVTMLFAEGAAQIVHAIKDFTVKTVIQKGTVAA